MPFEFRELDLAGVYEIVPNKIADSRGFFSEVFNREAFRKHGIVADWVQDNHTFSARRNVLRGLHFQRPPVAQDKLVRVLRGAVLDVIVDIRRGSPSFGRWTSLVVSAQKWNQVLVPKGFAHGMLTLEEGTEVIIKVSAGFSRSHDGVIRYDDPAIGVDWRLDGTQPIVSAKDRDARPLGEQDTGFVYEQAVPPR